MSSQEGTRLFASFLWTQNKRVCISVILLSLSLSLYIQSNLPKMYTHYDFDPSVFGPKNPAHASIIYNTRTRLIIKGRSEMQTKTVCIIYSKLQKPSEAKNNIHPQNMSLVTVPPKSLMSDVQLHGPGSPLVRRTWRWGLSLFRNGITDVNIPVILICFLLAKQKFITHKHVKYESPLWSIDTNL